jgi:hypothetical protein
MPVTDPNMPEPLKQAIETMEREVQSFKTDLSYQAPEMHRELWINLQGNLVDNHEWRSTTR